jgi:hypothetical protein
MTIDLPSTGVPLSDFIAAAVRFRKLQDDELAAIADDDTTAHIPDWKKALARWELKDRKEGYSVRPPF